MAWETEEKTLSLETLRAGVLELVRDGRKGFYLVAESGDRIVGQLMVTFEWSDWRNGHYWWLQSVYVAPDYRRQGVFRRLYREVETLARQAGDVCGLRLYVERANLRAQQTYADLGMVHSHYDMYEVEFER